MDSTALKPPADFLVLDSPNEGESGTFACPYDGCDGVVCGSAKECHAHVKEWHSPPYACAACSAYFAAQPALARHVKATGHQKWACAKDGCELKGFEFASHLEYREHIIDSDSHRSLGQREMEASPRDKVTDPDETLSEASSDDYFMCVERCCCRYLQRWSERQFEVHVKSHSHVTAMEEGLALERKGLDEDELEKKQRARREFLCDVRGCPHFGKNLASSVSYYNHLQTWNHLFPSDKDDEGDFWTQPQVRHCTVPGCLQFGRRFASETTYQRHIKSVQHLGAACGPVDRDARRRKRVNRQLFRPSDMEDEGEAVATPVASSSSSLPPTPESDLASPTPQRELFLERRNRQLEDEVQRLQAQMDWLCRRG